MRLVDCQIFDVRIFTDLVFRIISELRLLQEPADRVLFVRKETSTD